MPAYKRNTDRLQRIADKVLEANMQILAEVVQARSDPEQIRADALLPQSEAPMYLHIARAMGSVLAKTSGEANAPGQTMNVVIVGKATDKAAWLAEAQKMNRQRVIDTKEKPE